MKPTILYAGLGIIASTVLAEPVPEGKLKPVKLTELQMDTVAAGTAVATLSAVATAEGDSTHTYTSTTTKAFSTPGGVVDLALGGAVAVADGEESDTAIYAETYTDGDITIEQSNVVSPTSSIALGRVVAISVDLP